MLRASSTAVVRPAPPVAIATRLHVGTFSRPDAHAEHLAHPLASSANVPSWRPTTRPSRCMGGTAPGRSPRAQPRAARNLRPFGPGSSADERRRERSRCPSGVRASAARARGRSPPGPVTDDEQRRTPVSFARRMRWNDVFTAAARPIPAQSERSTSPRRRDARRGCSAPSLAPAKRTTVVSGTFTSSLGNQPVTTAGFLAHSCFMTVRTAPRAAALVPGAPVGRRPSGSPRCRVTATAIAASVGDLGQAFVPHESRSGVSAVASISANTIFAAVVLTLPASMQPDRARRAAPGSAEATQAGRRCLQVSEEPRYPSSPALRLLVRPWPRASNQ